MNRQRVARGSSLLFFFLAAGVFARLETKAHTTAPYARAGDKEGEIVANLAGGQVIVHVARDNTIVFATVDQPIEAPSVPPRVVDLDTRHVGILLGASEWRTPANPNPVRLDKDFQRATNPSDQRYEGYGEVDQDLEAIGVGFLEKLRPLVEQLHHQIEISANEPLLELVIIGFGPKGYGPEVWTAEYRVQQEQVGVRGEYWQTRVLRPRFMQLYPPEKRAPHTLVEARYPAGMKAPTLQDLIDGNDPRIAPLGPAEPRFAKVLELVHRGEAQKAVPADAADFLRAVLPLIAKNHSFILAKMEEGHGFDWIVPPEEPMEKAQKEDKNRPAGAPTLRKRPSPN